MSCVVQQASAWANGFTGGFNGKTMGKPWENIANYGKMQCNWRFEGEIESDK